MAFVQRFLTCDLDDDPSDPVWQLVLSTESEELLLKTAEAEMEEKVHQNAACWAGRVPLGCEQPPHDDDFEDDDIVDDEDYDDSAEEDVDDMDAGDLADFPDDLQADIDTNAAQ